MISYLVLQGTCCKGFSSTRESWQSEAKEYLKVTSCNKPNTLLGRDTEWLCLRPRTDLEQRRQCWGWGECWSMRSELAEKSVAGSTVWPLILSYRDRYFQVSGAPEQPRGRVFFPWSFYLTLRQRRVPSTAETRPVFRDLTIIKTSSSYNSLR